MEIREYQILAARTINPKLTTDDTINHALYGLAAEVGEILSLFQKELQGHGFNREDLKKEIGDVEWMLAERCTAFGFDLGNVCRTNIEKLKKRYPDGFTEEASVHRTE